jgi:translation initiation factor 2A
VEASILEYAPGGALYAAVDAAGVSVHDAATHARVARLDAPGALAVSWSPRGTFLTTFQRPQKPADGSPGPQNLRVWRAAAAGAPALALRQKGLNRDHWPSFQFTADEGAAAFMVTNTVHRYDPGNFAAGPIARLPVKGLSAFALSPAPVGSGNGNSASDPIVAVYVPEHKGAPGHVALYALADVAAGAAPPPLARRSFFRSNEATFQWNAPGTAVLCLASADVDATNQSYYGEQKLYFLAPAGGLDEAVPLPKEGPVHDVRWSPKGDCFVAIAGFMPAKATLFTDRCVAKFDLGAGPWSLARWSPSGRFLAICGFGNLPGDMVFFDKKADMKCRAMGAGRAANGVSAQWSPCGRFLLTATTAPRLRVDNGLQVWSYRGELVAEQRREVLSGAEWAPAPPGAFPDLPQSPRGAGGAAAAAGAAAGAAAAAAGAPSGHVAAPGAKHKDASGAAAIVARAKAAGYVPPHLRDNPGAAAAARERFSLAGGDDKGGRIVGGATVAARPAPGGNLPPGAAPPPSAAAAKNAKKRAAAKAKAALAAAGGG